MKRKALYTILNEIAPTYSMGQINGVIDKPCIVLRRGVDIGSTNNSIAYWNTWQLFIYSPNSPTEVDNIVNEIKLSIKNTDCEFVNSLDGDYFDEVFKAFSTSITLRTPIIY